ncbi:glucosaminidase domain-containing protein [Listeria valentina]|uniref:glucosaminidase domain-containing protein n=1 Tax=Listeria valentina TaxID=2705293 RepID=UPI0014318206|nr:glucosaminidase domain-containing protein [Listeria valentina]
MKKWKLALAAFITAAGISAPLAATQAEATDEMAVQASLQKMTLNQKQFIQDIAPKAQELQKKYQVLSSVSLAQAIVESNWGNSGLSTEANNLFGIKGSYNGSSVTMSTKEYSGDEVKQIDAAFRAYPDREASLEDHTLLFVNGTSGNPSLYQAVLGETDYKKAALAIEEAGYATDPNYAEVLIQTVEMFGLTAYDDIYDHMKKEESMLAYGTIEEPKDYAVWNLPSGMKDAEKTASAASLKGKQLRVGKKAEMQNGSHWFEIYDEQDKRIGWLEETAMDVFYTAKNETNFELKKYIIDSDQKIYRYPVEDQKRVVGEMKSYKGQKLEIDRRADVKNEYWYRFKDKDGQVIGWSKAPGFSDNNPNKTK